MFTPKTGETTVLEILGSWNKGWFWLDWCKLSDSWKNL